MDFELEAPFSGSTYNSGIPIGFLTTQMALRHKATHSATLSMSEQDKVLDPNIDFGHLVTSEHSGDDVNYSDHRMYYKDDHSFAAVTLRAEKSQTLRILQVSHYHRSAQECQKYHAWLISQIKTVTVNEDKVPVTFWYMTGDGPESYGQDIVVPKWDEIQGNYPTSLQESLSGLIDYKINLENGTLILLHGTAGTGKTYFIRSLLKAWREQCQINYIVDVDMLFDKYGAPYLVRMLLPDHDNRWKFFILEDTGEMVSKDARQVVGQGLSRMLNVSDGILGQGCKIILLMTTNEEIGTLHEAISRPGRCFANIQFSSLPPEDCLAWLKRHDITDVPILGNKTLAELYEIKKQCMIANKEKRKIGF